VLGTDLNCLKYEAKKLEMKGKERSSLLQLQTRPWLRAKVHPLAANVAPQPIIFYRVPSMGGILMFKRRPVKSNCACLEKYTEFGIDPTALGKQIKPGVTTPETMADF
jgi:hypothetical protein